LQKFRKVQDFPLFLAGCLFYNTYYSVCNREHWVGCGGKNSWLS